MPLFRPNTVVFQPIFYMFTRCMLCKEKSIETMEKSIVTMENSMNTMEKNDEHLGKSMNTMEKSSKTMGKNRWTVHMKNFSSKIQQSTAKRQSRSFFQEMTIFSCVKTFPGGRAFLQNASEVWWSQRNYVFKCFCVFSCAHLGFRYLLKVYLCHKKTKKHICTQKW